MVKSKIHKKDRDKFIKLATELSNLMDEITKYCPDAELYVSGEGITNFNLCNESSVNRENKTTTDWIKNHVIESVVVNHCDCEGW